MMIALVSLPNYPPPSRSPLHWRQTASELVWGIGASAGSDVLSMFGRGRQFAVRSYFIFETTKPPRFRHPCWRECLMNALKAFSPSAVRVVLL